MSIAIHRRTAIAAGLAACVFAAPSAARNGRTEALRSGDRSARIVVPFAAGGTTDLIARVVAGILSEATSWNFAVENRTGGSGNVSAEIVARAVPDGRTLLLGHVGTAVTNQYLYRYVPYDCAESFAPIALVGEVANVLVVHPSFRCRSLAELIHCCKAQPPFHMSYGSPAIGSMGHLAMEHLQGLAGIRLAHMPYRSRSRLIRDLRAGHVLVAMDNLPTCLPHIRSGAFHALAVSSAGRWFAAPEIPSVSEHGFGDFNATLWWYVAAPTGIRRALVNVLSEAIVKGLASEAAVARIRSLGVLETPRCADDLAAHIAAETVKWKTVIAAAGLEAR
ncbi:MAG: Bug family tripartite tricarboxylate transporter substrate binding protein [Reyranella sp.]|uniref:Bug family tripartite tricarboxylate transporter substrate binding protein n=1 Tax=Reyranella sp. TaxID=1929291 RepID=UPI003D0E0376